jgi:hypothetical protein
MPAARIVLMPTHLRRTSHVMIAGITRDYTRWGEPRRLTSVEFLALTALPSGLIVIDRGPVELPMLIVNRGAPATFVGFHAAMNPSMRRPLPFFQGRNIAPARLNTILLCDPSLYLAHDVTVGWFLGNDRLRLREELPRLLDHADRLMGASRRLLWGNSAGGTATLAYARPEDVAIAINPQTILARFTRGRTRPYVRHGWAANDVDAERSVMDAIGDLRHLPPQGRIVYVQNESDDHVERHMRPFADVIGMRLRNGEQGRFRVLIGDWGHGHVAPPADLQQRIVAEEADRLLAEMGLRQPLSARLTRLFGR